MNPAKVAKIAEKFLTDNAPTILTGVGVVGTVATAYLTGKATVDAVKKVNEKKFIKHLDEPALKTTVKPNGEELSKTETFKLVWMCYVPPVVVGTGTIAAIVFANKINTKRLAALAAGYGLLESRTEDYKEKMREKLGIKKETEARDELAQDRVDKNPPDPTLIITEGKSMFRDETSGRYFESTMEAVKRAENEINRKIIKDEYAVLTDWYDLLGLPATSISEDYGWDITIEPMEIKYSAVLTQEGKPVICMDYNIHPVRHKYDGGGDSKSKIRAV